MCPADPAMTGPLSATAAIRAASVDDPDRALVLLGDLLQRLFGIVASGLRINHDRYSLNSLNGFFETAEGRFFFKFHQEEGEEAMQGEYYRADLLARVGLPVDQPVLSSALAGEQILVYRRRDDARFSDVLRALDEMPDAGAVARAVSAEAALNDHLLSVAVATLHPITPAQAAAEPIHRLFHQRLVDPATRAYPGGRLAAYYVGKEVHLPGVVAPWADVAAARPVLNGVAYQHSLGALFDAARARLDPVRLADAGGITAHGDAHNANVWYERGQHADRLTFFDPAFAGSHVPSLLAEVKATFHNALAHPFWLYDSDQVAARFKVDCHLGDGLLRIDTDFAPNALREELLAVKAARFWAPWLAQLGRSALLPPDWEEVMRFALFLCPTLVMNLRAGPDGGRHSPQSSALGLMNAIMAGSRPIAGEDRMVRFFDAIRPGGG